MADSPGSSNVLAELDALTDLATAVTGMFVGAEIHLGKADIPVDRTTPIATLTAGEADFDAYAAKAVTFAAGSIDASGRAEVVGTHAEFRPGGAVTPNVIYYWWVENGAGLLIEAGRFVNAPIAMGAVTDAIVGLVRVRPSLAGSYVAAD